GNPLIKQGGSGVDIKRCQVKGIHGKIIIGSNIQGLEDRHLFGCRLGTVTFSADFSFQYVSDRKAYGFGLPSGCPSKNIALEARINLLSAFIIRLYGLVITVFWIREIRSSVKTDIWLHVMSDGFYFGTFFKSIKSINVGAQVKGSIVEADPIKAVFQDPIDSFFSRIIVIVDPVQIPQFGIVKGGRPGKIPEQAEVGRDRNVVLEAIFSIPQQFGKITEIKRSDLWGAAVGRSILEQIRFDTEFIGKPVVDGVLGIKIPGNIQGLKRLKFDVPKRIL